MSGDGKKTSHWYRHIVSKDNAKQVSTQLGAAAIAVGGILQTQPNLWVQIAGMVLIAVGGSGVGHNEG